MNSDFTGFVLAGGMSSRMGTDKYSLTIGDEVLIEGTGAYTTTYASVAFNGFEPLRSYVI